MNLDSAHIKKLFNDPLIDALRDVIQDVDGLQEELAADKDKIVSGVARSSIQSVSTIASSISSSDSDFLSKEKSIQQRLKDYKENLERTCELEFAKNNLEDFPQEIQKDISITRNNLINQVLKLHEKLVREDASIEKITMEIHKLVKKGTNEIQQRAIAKTTLRTVPKRVLLRNKFYDNLSEKLISAMQTKIEQVDNLSEIAEKMNKKPWQITQKDIQNYNNEKADAAFDELMSSSSSSSATSKKKKKKNRPSQKDSNPSSPSTEPSASFSFSTKLESKSHDKPTLTPVQLRSQYVSSIHQRKIAYKIDARVLRWENTNLEAIRKFDSHAVGKGYMSLTDDEIREQRIFHLFTGLELLISDKNDRQIYSFTTDKGLGMFATIQYNGTKQLGCIYLGIDKDNIIFHKYFVKSSFESENEIFQDKQKTVVSTEDAEEGWESTTSFEFNVSKEGIISINYPIENCIVEIMPIRKKLLDPKLFTK